MVDPVERLRELNVSYPEAMVERELPDFATYHGLSIDEALERMLAEAELVDQTVKRNHAEILRCGLGAKILRNAMAAGLAQGFAEREFVVREGWILSNDEQVEAGKARFPLSITNRYVQDGSGLHSTYTEIIGAPDDSGVLKLESDISVEEYDVVLACYQRMVELESSGDVTWVGSYSDCFDIPANLLHGYTPSRNRSYEYIDKA